MSQANVEATIDSIYQNRGKNWGTGVKVLHIGGSNASPEGTLQEPEGFVLDMVDGNPISIKEKVYVLIHNYQWEITMNS